MPVPYLFGNEIGAIRRDYLDADFASIAFSTNSIATIRTLNKSVNTYAYALGYYTPGDGGGGMYRYDATDAVSADNGGTVIVAADGARWKLIQYGQVATGQFGIIGAQGGAAQFNACVAAALASNFDIVVNVSCTIAAVVNINAPVWTPLTIRGCASATVTSTHNGVLFNDVTGGVRFENLVLTGPGKANAGAWAISSALGQGWVKGCKITGYYYGVDCSASTSGVIERNRFALNHAGINCVVVGPAFSNIVSVLRNYFDFNDFGLFASEMYGLTLDSNAFEFNSQGFNVTNVRELQMRGNNWFEANTTNAFQILGASTGTIGYETHVVAGAGNTYVLSAGSRMFDYITQPVCLLRLSAAQAIPHNAATDVLFDTETLDPSGMHAGGASASVTIAIAGVYDIAAVAQFAAIAAPGAGVIGRVSVKRNGVVLREATALAAANVPTAVAVSFPEEFASGDVLQMSVYQNSGVALNLLSGAVSTLSVMQRSLN